jgi:3-oxoadipate enol-lactonase
MNSEKEGRYLIDDKDLPIVLVHGTMGKSEDWSRVVGELSNSRWVIRPNYIERVAGTNLTSELAIKDLADERLTGLSSWEGRVKLGAVAPACTVSAAAAAWALMP